MKKTLMLISIISLFSITTFAADYGMAGCGLGTYVIKGNGKGQILAATTNGTSGNQTFGITFGTSNCTADGVVKAENEREAFVDASKSELMGDISNGEGSY